MTCVDTNIILEILLKRSRLTAAMLAISQVAKYGICITPNTASTVMYYAEKQKLDLTHTESYLSSFQILEMTGSNVKEAFSIFLGDDFEDALQVSTAKAGGCSSILTHNQKMCKKYQGKIKMILVS